MGIVTGVAARPAWRFQLVAAGIGVGGPAPAGWQPLASLPLLIVVGVTGVGKSTALAWLQRQAPGIATLPERRALTDRCIIPLVWDEGRNGRPPDRLERLQCTRRFRDWYAGGMAEVLCRLTADAHRLAAPVAVFDGLRGADEVACATARLPHARFVALTARDGVRLRRLLGRNEPFDELRHGQALDGPATGTGATADQFTALGGPGAAALFSPVEQAAIVAMVADGTYSAEAVRTKLAIVVAERHNYDPEAACALLRERAADRSLIIDTEDVPADQVAAAMLDFCRWPHRPATPERAQDAGPQRLAPSS